SLSAWYRSSAIGTWGMEMLDELRALSEACEPPFQLVCAAAGLVFSTSLPVRERDTNEEPPDWNKRDAGWTIDRLLGPYDPDNREITIYNKGVEHAVKQLDTTTERLRYVVRLHEWSHAVFHVGVDREKAHELAKASLADDKAAEQQMVQTLTEAYQSTAYHVHEQIAQA